jgi:hypothetical protein
MAEHIPVIVLSGSVLNVIKLLKESTAAFL